MIKKTLALSISAIVVQVISLIISVVVGKTLGGFELGKLFFLNTTYMIFGLFSSYGTQNVIYYYVSPLKLKINKSRQEISVCNSFVLRNSIAAIFVSYIIGKILQIYIDEKIEMSLFLLYAISGVFSGLDSYTKSSLIASGRVNRLAAIIIASATIQLLVSLFTLKSFGLIGIGVGILLATVTSTAMSLYSANDLLNFKFNIFCNRNDVYNEVGKKIRISFLSSITVMPIVWVSQQILLSKNGGEIQVSLVGIGMQWMGALQIVPASIVKSLTGKFTEIIKNGNTRTAIKLYNRLAYICMIITSFFSAGLIYLSNFIFDIYNVHLDNANIVFGIFCVSAILQAGLQPQGLLINTLGQFKNGFLFNLVWGSVFLLVVIFLQGYGATSVGTGYLISYSILFAITLISINRLGSPVKN